ncbi:hypothetical protein MRB53_012011 [Persea americana]|uniref:Uncharacterized protein n=1 Tax=Persea americana TaxID=3435 RepID=A0ACC2LWL8_PERAE|nr:hypothetical protein MRB53_012011 [Persea americana]
MFTASLIYTAATTSVYLQLEPKKTKSSSSYDQKNEPSHCPRRFSVIFFDASGPQEIYPISSSPTED